MLTGTEMVVSGEIAMLSMRQLAAGLGISVRHLEKLVEQGAVPAPIRLGRCRRFVRRTIEDWVAIGCPGNRTPADVRQDSNQQHGDAEVKHS